MKQLILLATLLVGMSAYGQPCDCGATLKNIRYHIENNYAGWFDKTKQLGAAELEKLLLQVEVSAGAVTSDSACYLLLNRYVNYFKDGHLRLSYTAQQPVNGQLAEPPPPTVATSPLTGADLMRYFKSKKSLDKLEGYWENDTYKMGIIRSKAVASRYEGIIVASKNSNWKPGEIKMNITRKASGGYNAQIISGDKSVITDVNVKLERGILNAAPFFLARTFPSVPHAANLAEYEIENDPTGPRLNFPRKDAAVWTFPNFYMENAQVVKYLLEKHKAKLAPARYWIVDLRNNEGGNVRVGNLLLPYFFSKPIVYHNTKVRLTKDNFDNWYQSYVRESYENFSDAQKREFDSVMSITKQHYGEFRNIYNENKTADTLVFEQPAAAVPEKIALLINENTYSSAELFTLLARQSDKVLVMGQPSAGTIDYDNVLRYKLACADMQLTLPMGRYNWLDEGISIDRDKIQPDAAIDSTIKDWVVYSYSKLKSTQRKK